MSEVLQASIAGEQAENLVVATLNINGLPTSRLSDRSRALLPSYAIRHRELCRQFEASDVDVINFQEVWTHRNRRLLEKNLPSFGYSAYATSLFGPKGALVTFSRTPLEKVDYVSYLSTTRHADHSELPALSVVKSWLKGILISRLTTMPLTVINTHPLANDDWNWSDVNRFHDVQAAQLDTLATVARRQAEQAGRLVLGADLNVAKDSNLYRHFLKQSGLHDSFAGDYAPTFHPEFLEADQTSRCIDFLLTNDEATASNVPSERMFQESVTLDNQPGVYITDHQGLRTTVSVP